MCCALRRHAHLQGNKKTTKIREFDLTLDKKSDFFIVAIMSAETRSKTKIPLFDHPLEHIPGLRLPTNKQTYQHCLYHTSLEEKFKRCDAWHPGCRPRFLEQSQVEN
jgi:hypothetical protein